MTKITLYVKMLRKEHFNTENNARKIRLEISTEDILSLCSELRETCKKEEKKMAKEYEVQKEMEEMHVDLESAVNYLVQLFCANGKKYSCTQTKIGKILSIVAFLYSRDNKRLFTETIYKYDGCGVSIDGLSSYVDREAYYECEYSDNKEPITCDELIFNLENVPERHKLIEDLDDGVRATITKVFFRFGAYKASELGRLINPLVNYNGVSEPSGIINLETIYSLKKEYFGECEERTLIDFLFD